MLFLLLRHLAVARYDWHVAFSPASSVNFGDVIGVLVGTSLGATTLAVARLRDGSTVTGHVMEVQSPCTEVLTERGRIIRVLMSSDVVSRTEAEGG